VFRVSELEHWSPSSQFGCFFACFIDVVVASRHILTRNRVTVWAQKGTVMTFSWTILLIFTPIDVSSVVLILFYVYDSNFPQLRGSHYFNQRLLYIVICLIQVTDAVKCVHVEMLIGLA